MIAYGTDDTITAIASAPGGAVRGIVRISGPATVVVLAGCFHSDAHPRWDALRVPRCVAGTVHDDELGPVPAQLLLWPGHRSYTRQPAAELHTLGALPLLQSLVTTLCARGARPAEPGEFTLRAFLAGRIDLTQAEAVLGVIDAHRGAPLDVALRQLAGGLATPLQRLRDELLELLAQVEAGLDFADEDLELLGPPQVVARVTRLETTIADLAGQMARRQCTETPGRVAFRGRPNAGKSSLLNALSNRPAALVSPQVHTTRDFVTCQVQWGEQPVLLIDTAGLEGEPVDEPVAAAARQVAVEQCTTADLELLCVDSSQPDCPTVWQTATRQPPLAAERLLVLTKTDACRYSPQWPAEAWPTSSLRGEGLEPLRNAICGRLAAQSVGSTQVVPATAIRCRASLAQAGQALGRAAALAGDQQGDELVAWELRAALEQIGHVAGTVFTEDLLTRIFGRFCIGK